MLQFLLVQDGLVLLELLQAETVTQSSNIVFMMVSRQEWRRIVLYWKVLSALARLT